MIDRDGLLLMQRIVQSPAPPPGWVVMLSAYDEPPHEDAARRTKASSFGEYSAPLAHNTYDEARFVRSCNQWSDVIIVTSAYHQLRAFLTFVKVFQGTGVRLWNAPAPSGWEKLDGELAKIAEYQARGHVATYREGRDHLAWRDSYNCAGAA